MTFTITSIKYIQQYNIKEQNISLLGYGSLMNPESVQKRLGYIPKIMPIEVNGLEREYNATLPIYYHHLKQQKNTAFLNVHPNKEQIINGVILEVNHNDLTHLITREKNYQLTKIQTQEDFTFYTFITPQEHHHRNYKDPVVSQYYINIVETKLEEQYGKTFLQKFKETTRPIHLPILEGEFSVHTK